MTMSLRLKTPLFAAFALLLGSALAPSAANASIEILSATVRDQRIPGATVTVQKNGTASAAVTTDARGRAALPATGGDAGALMIVRKPGYSDLVVKCPCDGLTYALSPVMRNLDGLRVVLNWGEEPPDLDSHVVYPGNHVYFSRKQGADANLDVDDTTSYGPETITLERKHDGERYVYAVHDYTHRGNPESRGLSNSGARVYVYVGQTLIRTYQVPRDRPGNLWVVFAIDGNGTFETFNTIRTVAGEDRMDTAEFNGVVAAAPLTEEVVTVDAGATASARDLNAQGERAYHAGQLDAAIALYQQAIERNPSYGQAYANLGLAFQKAGRTAEALFANRKAIALADGPTAATVRAGAYYNNARLYEDAGQWADALREYRKAQSQKASPVYDKAIRRMQAKGAR